MLARLDTVKRTQLDAPGLDVPDVIGGCSPAVADRI